LRETPEIKKQNTSRALTLALNDIKSADSVEPVLAPASDNDDRQHYDDGDNHQARAAFHFEEKGRLERLRESEFCANSVAFLVLFIPILILSIAYGYFIFATQAASVAYAGIWLPIARGFGLMLMITTQFVIFFMIRGLLTRIRLVVPKWTVLTSILDKHVLMHRLLAGSLVPASIVHTVAHYLGMARALELNPSGMTMPRAPGSETVYLSWPFVSGYVLWIILLLFAGLSAQSVRRKMFEVFHYPHLTLTWLWVVFLVNHGAIQWSGFGVPASVILVLPIFLAYGIERGLSIRAATNPAIHIESASVYGTTMVVQINLRGSNYKYHTGMYSMLRVPEISKYQWHPMTIASGSEHQLRLVMGIAGNWTDALAKLIMKAQSVPKGQPVKYPKIDVRGGYGAPASGIQIANYAIMVGGGVGATPFLSFLSSICNHELFEERAPGSVDYHQDYSNIVKARFYWVTREPADFIWVNYYQHIISSHPQLQNRVSLHLVLTKTLETTQTDTVSAAELALFWSAVRCALKNDAKAIQSTIGVPTQFGRPDWEKEFVDFASTVDLKTTPKEKTNAKIHLPKSRFTDAVEVGVYICGNVHLQKGCEQAAVKCNNHEIEFKLFIEEF
jgi:predicted ferric reductase